MTTPWASRAPMGYEDSAACFAALLGTPDNGRFLITPRVPSARVTRKYRDSTLILETRFETKGGAATLIDFMPIADGRRRSIRIASTDLGREPPAADQKAAEMPRVSARTLIPLMRHLNGKLSPFAEEVIRDDHPSPFHVA